MSQVIRVLVVDDEPLSLDVLTRRLQAWGFAVRGVASGAEALQEVDRDLPDVMLLDVAMPEMNGLEVLRRIRQKWAHEQLPVILVTAMVDSDDMIKGLEAGANDYVVKPVNMPVLLARIRVALEIRESVRRLVEAERQRALISTLGETCSRIAQPMTAAMMNLEAMARGRLDSAERVRSELSDLLTIMNELAQVVHRLRDVAKLRTAPYVEQLDMVRHRVGR